MKTAESVAAKWYRPESPQLCHNAHYRMVRPELRRLHHGSNRMRVNSYNHLIHREQMILHYRPQNNIETLPSPLTGKPVQFSVRAFCPKCGCLLNRSFAATSNVKNVLPPENRWLDRLFRSCRWRRRMCARQSWCGG